MSIDCAFLIQLHSIISPRIYSITRPPQVWGQSVNGKSLRKMAYWMKKTHKTHIMAHGLWILHDPSMFENSFQSSEASPSLLAAALPKSIKPDSRRLRASCDGCYLSKVKCTKETPSCARCSNHHVLCRYSPSQRVGKPKKPREDHQAREAPKKNATSAAKLSRSTVPCDAILHTPPYSWNLNLDPNIAAANLEDHLSIMWQGALPLTNSEHRPVMTDSNGGSGLPSPCDSLSTVGSDCLSISQPSSAAAATIGEQLHHPQPQVPFSPECMLLQDDFPMLHFPPLYPSLPDNCICATTTFDILRTLHDQSSTSAFDIVLAANKSAVSSISTILSCPCIRDPTSIMTLAVALTKIMSRYQSIGRLSPVPNPAFHAIPTSPSLNALGPYKLKRANEEQLKLQGILSGLQTVDDLMPRFQERWGAWPEVHEARVYSELIAFLRKRLRDVVEGLHRDLQKLHQPMQFLSWHISRVHIFFFSFFLFIC